MTAINIDRLTLRLSGISERDGQHLARLITEGLTTASIMPEGSYQLDTMRVNVTASPGSSVDMLAQQIVAAILRQIEQTL
jgi:hypothetical protein